MLWQRFWLDLCTKQVVSARACACQFLPYSSSGVKSSGKISVQTDSCLNSDQFYTLFISVVVSKGGLVGGAFLTGGPKYTNDCQEFYFLTPPLGEGL